MYHLIKKDFLIQKKSLKLSLLLMLFFSVTFSTLGSNGLTVSILAISYMLVLGASALEDNNNSDMMLASLPIKKHIIVLSKYISVYVFAAYALLINCIIHLTVDLFQISNFSFPITGNGIFGAVIAVTLLFSISLPLLFKFGYLKSKMANYVILFVLVFGGSGITDNLAQNPRMRFLSDMPDIGTMILIFIGLMVLMFVSYFLSLTFYRNREF